MCISMAVLFFDFFSQMAKIGLCYWDRGGGFDIRHGFIHGLLNSMGKNWMKIDDFDQKFRQHARKNPMEKNMRDH